jgi:hypothetical protein
MLRLALHATLLDGSKLSLNVRYGMTVLRPAFIDVRYGDYERLVENLS